MPRSNAVITGLGVVSSIGIGANDFWRGLVEKRSGIRSLADRTDEGAKPSPGHQQDGLWIGGPILDFDAKQFVRPRKSLKVMCREIQTAFAAAQLAIDSGQLTDRLPAKPDGPLRPADVGAVFGSEMFYGTPAEMVDAIKACQDDQGRIDSSHFGLAAQRNIMPLWMLKYLPNMPACHIGIAINSHGPNNSLVSGDISGPAAMMEAASCIDRGIASTMIAGATGTRISTTRLNYRGNLPVSDAYDPVEHSCRPHDPTSIGVVGGEAAAAVILESSESAHARQIVPLAELAAFANCFVASDNLRSAADGRSRGSSAAIVQAISTVLADANVTVDQIGAVVSHGCGDPEMDAAERAALHRVLPRRPVAAPMAAVGHTGAASGSIAIATAILAVHHRTIPPTIRVATTSDEVSMLDAPVDLASNFVIALTHSAEGNATALLIRTPT